MKGPSQESMRRIQAQVADRLRERSAEREASSKQEEDSYRQERSYGEFFLKCAVALARGCDVHPSELKRVYYEYANNELVEISPMSGVRSEYSHTYLRYLFPYSGSAVALRAFIQNTNKAAAWEHFLRVLNSQGTALVPCRMLSRQPWIITNLQAEKPQATLRLAIPLPAHETTAWVMPMADFIKEHAYDECEGKINEYPAPAPPAKKG